jgi:transglutaminase/protease-like cytokinesis protein 3
MGLKEILLTKLNILYSYFLYKMTWNLYIENPNEEPECLQEIKTIEQAVHIVHEQIRYRYDKFKGSEYKDDCSISIQKNVIIINWVNYKLTL